MCHMRDTGLSAGNIATKQGKLWAYLIMLTFFVGKEIERERINK